MEQMEEEIEKRPRIAYIYEQKLEPLTAEERILFNKTYKDALQYSGIMDRNQFLGEEGSAKCAYEEVLKFRESKKNS